jgi:glyoxylase-like metal-dependent hydrolase (beta-lactamase superfamily II)
METNNYTIQVLQTGHIELRGACIYYMIDFDRWEPFIYTTVVVRGNGKTVVINSGVDDDPSFLDPLWKDWPGERNLVISPEEKTAAALAKVGVKPEEVTHLILTPLVYYATGNVDLFTNAEISLLKRGWLDFHAPKNRAADALRKTAISDRVLTHLVTTAWPRVRLLEDEDQVLPGIDVWFAGVHHRSTMAVRIQTARGPVIYSDCCFKYRNLEENLPPGYVENIEDVWSSYARIRKEAAIVLPAFDPEIFSRNPGGTIE